MIDTRIAGGWGEPAREADELKLIVPSYQIAAEIAEERRLERLARQRKRKATQQPTWLGTMTLGFILMLVGFVLGVGL